jgi:hypothetical protein
MMMRLGELIDTLEQLDPDLGVRFATGEQIAGFESWRGDYAELSLAPQWREVLTPITTVGELLAEAHRADGGVFVGYKGGRLSDGPLHPRVGRPPRRQQRSYH